MFSVFKKLSDLFPDFIPCSVQHKRGVCPQSMGLLGLGDYPQSSL